MFNVWLSYKLTNHLDHLGASSLSPVNVPHPGRQVKYKVWQDFEAENKHLTYASKKVQLHLDVFLYASISEVLLSPAAEPSLTSPASGTLALYYFCITFYCLILVAHPLLPNLSESFLEHDKSSSAEALMQTKIVMRHKCKALKSDDIPHFRVQLHKHAPLYHASACTQSDSSTLFSNPEQGCSGTEVTHDLL